MDIKITRTTNPKEKPKGSLGFGEIFTDHMFMMNYTEGRGWHDARIVPYGDISLSPASKVLHYGQESFEGLKAYKSSGGSHYLFRPDMNAKRMNSTNLRMCIPEVPEEDFLEAVKTLVQIDAGWIPKWEEGSLYIRPFFIATDPYLGLLVSKTYLFMIILSPSSAFFGGLKPISIWVEDEYVRAVRGGTGCAKTGGNYAASLAAQAKAQKEGFSQVMWLDGLERKYIDEVGAMNVFFKIGGRLITPMLNGSILPGITRDSIIALCRDFDMEVEERPISIEEVVAAAGSGALEEAFGAGTAVVISPIGKLRYKEQEIMVGDGNAGSLANKIYDTLTAIQRGDAEDKFGWRVDISSAV